MTLNFLIGRPLLSKHMLNKFFQLIFTRISKMCGRHFSHYSVTFSVLIFSEKKSHAVLQVPKLTLMNQTNEHSCNGYTFKIYATLVFRT